MIIFLCFVGETFLGEPDGEDGETYETAVRHTQTEGGHVRESVLTTETTVT